MKIVSCVGAVVLTLLAVWLGVSEWTSPPEPGAQTPDAGSGAAAGPPIFEDVTDASGIRFEYRNGEEADHYAIIETLGGGVALLDYDNDGLLDVFLGGGGHFQGTTVLGHPGRLYRNLGNFRFQDVSEAVGLARPLQYSHGVSAFDYDNDGWVDLLVSGYSRLILFRNESDGRGGRRFVDVTARVGLNDTLWSTSTAWGDLNGDGLPDIYVCHYGNWGFSGTGPDGQPFRHPTDCKYDTRTRDVCQPKKFTPLPHTVYVNNGDGTFADVSASLVRRVDPETHAVTVGRVRTDGRGIGVLMVDVNNDGRPDVYTANDTDDNFLYVNRADRYGRGAPAVTEDIGMRAGVAVDGWGKQNGSMGLAVGDYDRSGRASLLVTNYERELTALYRNRTTDPAEPRFEYATQGSGLGILNGDHVSWGTCLVDFDLNGWEDTVIVNGHAIRHPHTSVKTPGVRRDRKQKPFLFLNNGTEFVVESARGGPYFEAPHNARGTATGDLDNDGRPDLVVCGQNEPVRVLRNVAPVEERRWVGLKLVGTSQRDLVGSRVVIETATARFTRFIKGGASYGSTDDPRLHFGLGSDDTIKACTIHWSHGPQEVVTGLKADGYFLIREGTAVATPIGIR
ncbi:CRTAC1 family protein [Frigoriglobus tundricola]|nr:CRTAC1 family protein [Frigoriglobus tundricola]